MSQFSKEVTNKDGVVKMVYADSQADLDAAVKTAKADEAPATLDINDPKDGNKFASPDNRYDNRLDAQNREVKEDSEEVRKGSVAPGQEKGQVPSQVPGIDPTEKSEDKEKSDDKGEKVDVKSK